MDRFLLQKDGKVVEWTEEKLRKQLRTGNLDGLELARRPEDDRWRPLHELALFREEVPHEGDPKDVARRNVVRGFAWHALAFTAVTLFVLGVSVPAAIWAIFVIAHGARALPLALALAHEGKLFAMPPSATAPVLPPPREGAALASGEQAEPARALSPGDRFAADLAEVRTLLGRRSPLEVAPMLEELDRVAASVAQLRDKLTKLAALTGTDERDTLATRVRTAQDELEAAGGADALLRRRLDVLRERERATERAQRTLDRLRIREGLALDQVQQLRLDLVRAEADDLEPTDLGDRLEQIRLEAEAADDVEGLLAR